MNTRINELDIKLREILVTSNIRKDIILFMKEFCEKSGIIGELSELKPMSAYRVGNVVLKLIDKPKHLRNTIEDAGINTMKLTRYAEELGLGVKFLGGYSIVVPEDMYDHEIYVMVTEYKPPVSQKFNVITLIQKIIDSPIQIHPDFCLKNMVMDENKNVLLIDWDYYQYETLFREHITPQIAQKIMVDRYNGFLKGQEENQAYLLHVTSVL